MWRDQHEEHLRSTPWSIPDFPEHPREHPPEHPDFPEHPQGHFLEHFQGFPVARAIRNAIRANRFARIIRN